MLHTDYYKVCSIMRALMCLPMQCAAGPRVRDRGTWLAHVHQRPTALNHVLFPASSRSSPICSCITHQASALPPRNRITCTTVTCRHAARTATTAAARTLELLHPPSILKRAATSSIFRPSSALSILQLLHPPSVPRPLLLLLPSPHHTQQLQLQTPRPRPKSGQRSPSHVYACAVLA